ncbi:MAG TPA: hypothetical protein VFG69_11550 [Nannocystaceae bacterium]|nr:hypothetical protein [Nannocystaceae bacterium]
MAIARPACSLALVLGGGCFTADLDPDKTGVFACASDEDCAGDDVCVNQRCESEVQTVEIRNPEDEDTFDVTDAALDMPRMISVTIAGTLELVAPGGDHVSGEGHIAVFVDGMEIAPVTSGPFSAGIVVPITVANRPGPHRVAIKARRNDGTDYDNIGAQATRLFWIDDGTPQVAIKSPWPNTTFGLDSQTITFQVTSLRVMLVPPMAEGMIDPAKGHTHIYYDETFPACLMDPMCDPNYIAIGEARNQDLMATIPGSAETSATLTAVLRNVDHTLYLFDPDGDGPMEERPILDTITIVREE